MLRFSRRVRSAKTRRPSGMCEMPRWGPLPPPGVRVLATPSVQKREQNLGWRTLLPPDADDGGDYDEFHQPVSCMYGGEFPGNLLPHDGAAPQDHGESDPHDGSESESAGRV